MNPLRKPFRHVFKNATLAIVLVNIAVYFLIQMEPRLAVYGGLSYGGLVHHMFWQPLTYLFIHGGWRHILFNMIALFFFGIPVEKAVGTKEFLLFYFLCGILDGLICTAIYRFLGMNILLMGASGAVYGVLLAYAVIYPRSVIYVWGILPLPAPILVLVYALMEFFSQFLGRDGISHCAHLSGLLLAWLYFVIRMGVHPLKVWRDNL
ncbi:MAG: rhomboid family intramembrane serine protease [Treponema sp.]|nr:rhomboid family intramembrane serine protease [Candidatus Treponema equi]